jgi:hypothetical protein
LCLKTCSKERIKGFLNTDLRKVFTQANEANEQEGLGIIRELHEFSQIKEAGGAEKDLFYFGKLVSPLLVCLCFLL